jgi:hypothetical protein
MLLAASALYRLTEKIAGFFDWFRFPAAHRRPAYRFRL